MSLKIPTEISICESFEKFIEQIALSNRDLMITNEDIIRPYMDKFNATCGMLYTEKYGVTEPTNDMINAMIKDMAGKGYERVIAIGGGAVIDASKQLIFEEGLSCEDLYERKPDLDKKRKLIAVPTTCGTGSEVTNISVTLFEEQKTKIGLVSPTLFPDEAVLIPSMLGRLPYDVFASSSLDALIHAVESFTSCKADALTKILSADAMKKIIRGYRQITEKNVSFHALTEDFSIASCVAGIAFLNAGCGGVHAMSFPLGGSFHVPHGKANYYLFAEVFKEYVTAGADLSELEDILKNELETVSPWESFAFLLDKIMRRANLAELGVAEKDIKKFIPSVIANQQRLLVNMPVELTGENMRNIYMRCL